MAVGGTVVVVVLVVREGKSLADIMGFAIFVSNAVALLGLMLFMGYGLLNVPRMLWHRGDVFRTQRWYRYQTVVLHEALLDAEADFQKSLKKLKALDSQVGRVHPLRPYVEEIIDKVDATGQGDYYDAIEPGTMDHFLSKFSSPTYEGTVELHGKFQSTSYAYQRAEVLYKKHLHDAFVFETFLAENDAMVSPADAHYSLCCCTCRSRVVSSPGIYQLYYLYKRYIEPTIFRVLAVLTVLASAIVIWSEVVIFTTVLNDVPDLSPVSWLITASADVVWLLQEVAILSVLSYMTLCTFFGLFKFRIFEMYRVVGHHQTDGRSLLFSTNWLCRLIPALCYNFLALTNQRGDSSAFSQIMSNMGDKGEGFNTYFPIFLLVVVVFSIFNVYGRILDAIGIQQFQFRDSFEDAKISKGYTHIQKEKEAFRNAVEEDSLHEELDEPRDWSKHRGGERGSLLADLSGDDDDNDAEAGRSGHWGSGRGEDTELLDVIDETLEDKHGGAADDGGNDSGDLIDKMKSWWGGGKDEGSTTTWGSGTSGNKRSILNFEDEEDLSWLDETVETPAEHETTEEPEPGLRDSTASDWGAVSSYGGAWQTLKKNDRKSGNSAFDTYTMRQ
eukprot:CAMPEP_0119127586 /NCGR_PEP_ID=MMETSP1310-20130426/6079_1 /TAXON_ID=464262 /ORGANISM="Genus nov. species nov., Strain RCC2339" /LENGTH=613 /DNA_ID=CAMNT_0007117857 /DNA_START=27 /DNA_END=1868 /DNA_ORIENTATION=-